MPLFPGSRNRIERQFIEMTDAAKGSIAWKWPDQQIIKGSRLNVDLDYQAVFTDVGKVIGVMGPGRHELSEGASRAFGWLVDRLTNDAYYDTELFFVTTRDITGVQFGGPLDHLADGPTGLVVSVRAFGELAFKVTDPAKLLGTLIGTGTVSDLDAKVTELVKNHALGAIREVVPALVAQHGVLAMGSIQAATETAALENANQVLAPYGLSITAFAQLNVNIPEQDAAQIKRLASLKAMTGLAGSFDGAVRGESALQIAEGVAEGTVSVQPNLLHGLTVGAPAAAPAPEAPAAAGAKFCVQCGNALVPGGKFCPGCGTAAA